MRVKRTILLIIIIIIVIGRKKMLILIENLTTIHGQRYGNAKNNSNLKSIVRFLFFVGPPQRPTQYIYIYIIE